MGRSTRGTVGALLVLGVILVTAASAPGAARTSGSERSFHRDGQRVGRRAPQGGRQLRSATRSARRDRHGHGYGDAELLMANPFAQRPVHALLAPAVFLGLVLPTAAAASRSSTSAAASQTIKFALAFHDVEVDVGKK